MSLSPTVSKKAQKKPKANKAKARTAQSLRKEVQSLREENAKLLGEIGYLSEMYFNALAAKEQTERISAESARNAVRIAVERIIDLLCQTYGFSKKDFL